MSGGFSFNAKQNPDAELIRLCDELADLNQTVELLMDGDDAAPVEANYARWEELSTRAALIPAETMAGLRARLRAIGPGVLTEMPRLATEPGSLRAQLVSAADDLCRFAVGHVPAEGEILATVARLPDAELVAIGREAEPIIAETRRREAAYWAGDGEIDTLEFYEQLDTLYDRAIRLPAITMEGARTKLLFVRHEMFATTGNRGVIDPEKHLNADDRMTWSLCDDLLGPVSAIEGDAA